MRVVRLLIAVLIASPLIVLALSTSRFSQQPFAQITAAPGPAPVTAPVAPGQPQPFSTIGALPALAPAPGTTLAIAPSAAPTPRVFRCTCNAPGTYTEWAGLVSSSSYVLAGQAARNQCASYLFNANAQSPYITPDSASQANSTLSQQRPTIYNGTAFTQRAQVSTSVGQNVLLPRADVVPLTAQCTRCACN
jgi:hypothetical protein